MVEKKDMQVEGFYELGGNRGTFEGSLIRYSDGRVIGSMVDHEAPEKSKLVLGLISDLSFQFWKMQPLANACYPIVYNMNSTSENIYDGKWIAFDNLQDYGMLLDDYAPQISEAHFLERSKANELMASIPRESVEVFCNPGLMQAILEHGNYSELNLK